MQPLRSGVFAFERERIMDGRILGFEGGGCLDGGNGRFSRDSGGCGAAGSTRVYSWGSYGFDGDWEFRVVEGVFEKG